MAFYIKTNGSIVCVCALDMNTLLEVEGINKVVKRMI